MLLLLSGCEMDPTQLVVVVVGAHALVEIESGVLDVLSLDDPASPVVVGHADLTVECDQGQIAARGRDALVACGSRLLHLGIADPANPTVEPLVSLDDAYGVAVDSAGGRAYVAVRGGLTVLSLGCLPPP